MNRKSTPAIAAPIAELQRQLDQFRSTRPRRTKLPESLWQAAVELAPQHGIYSVAHPLRLDYRGLKKRLGEPSSHRRKTPREAFVELITPHPATVEECVIEVESSERRCVSSGRRRRHRIGPACCEPGGKRKDDSDYAADADSGGGRVGRLPQGHRLVGRVVPAEAGCRSIFGLPVRVPQPASNLY